MRENRLRTLWHAGKGATNAWLHLASAYGAEIVAHQGWDSITVDLQHGTADYAAMCAMLTAISTTNAVPLVRVPWNEPGDVMRALDAGAYGVICPTVNTRAECERFVGAVRYAPQGYRSVGPNRAVLYGGPDYLAASNKTVLAIAQIETAAGLANVDEIAATPGLDMLYIGPSDLGLSMGREARMDQTDPPVAAAIDRILAAAKAAGKTAGIFCVAPDYANAMLAKGFDLVTALTDASVLRSAGAETRRQIKT